MPTSRNINFNDIIAATPHRDALIITSKTQRALAVKMYYYVRVRAHAVLNTIFIDDTYHHIISMCVCVCACVCACVTGGHRKLFDLQANATSFSGGWRL